jgi:hypothetical protein
VRNAAVETTRVTLASADKTPFRIEAGGEVSAAKTR